MIQPSRTLEGKVIAITGAARGIGREIALLAAREGACVLVNDCGGAADGSGHDATAAQQVVAEIEAAGGRALANEADVSEPAQAGSVIDDAVKGFGRIDAVVNNAAILRDRIFHKMSYADWKAVLDVNLTGCFNVARAAAPHFREQGGGAYVHFTSTSGLIGNVGQANYAASKLGVVGLSTSLALEMRGHGVRSNCIAPFAWSRLAATIPARTEQQQRHLERFKTMSADKIAPLAVFLCGDAAREISGQVFCVRQNEIFLFSLPRPVRSVHRAQGWSQAALAEQLLPAFRPAFQPLQSSGEVFPWDPI